MNRSFMVALAVLSLFLFTGAALAQATNLTQPDTSMQSLLDMIVSASSQWTARLRDYAVRLLFLLAVIQFVYNFAPLVFRGADLGDIAHELVKTVLVTGFFYALIIFAPEWAKAIVESFRQAGAHASGLPKELMPGDMFATAVEFAEKMMSGISFFSPATSLLVSIAAIIVLLCFAFIAAFLFVTLVESYFIVNAAVLFYGFGGSQWTREYAIAPLRFAMAIGAKLFVLTLLVGLIMSVASQWEAAYRNDNASVLTIVGLALVCAYLTKSLAELVQGMIAGTSMGGGHAIGSMAALALAGGAMAAGGAGAAGAAGAAGEAAGGAAGAGGASAAGNGGLAGLIDSSFAGVGRSADIAGGGASVGSSIGGSEASAAARAASPRVGGSAAASSPASSPPKPSTGGAGAAQQAAKAADQVQPQGQREDGQQQAAHAAQPAAGRASPRQGVSAGDLAHAALRGAGVLSAIAVPGMEGAASVGARPGQPPQMPEADADGQHARPENVIRPATTEDEAPAGFAKPSPAGHQATSPDTEPAARPSPVHLAGLRVPGMDPSLSPDLGGAA
jgi:type IV secretion system protein TrbL